MFVDEDYPMEIQQRRSMVRPILKFTVKNEKYKGKVKLRYDNLVLDGVEYSMDDLHKLPDDISSQSSCQKSNDWIIAFSCQHCPLCNFYQSCIEHDGLNFKTSEDSIEHAKAIMFDDQHTATCILHCNSAREAKQLGKKCYELCCNKMAQ